MSLLLSLLILFGAEDRPPSMPPLLKDARYLNVVMRIYGEPELLRNHMGYWAALQSRPDWFQREAVWWELARTNTLGPLLIRADELLQANPDSDALYNAFYEALAQNDTLRKSVERFERAALDKHGEPSEWLHLLGFLRNDPAAALNYLGGVGADTPLPDPLKPFATTLMNGAEWQGLRGPLSEISSSDAARQALLPWWQRAAALDAGHDGLFSKLSTQLLQSPNRFWALYHRELALAAEPALRDWTHWWHRRLRRAGINYGDYLAYLGAIRTAQETPPAAPGKPWPPSEAPPPLSPIAEDHLPPLENLEIRKPVRPQTAQPERPGIAYPDRPERVQMRQSERLKAREAAPRK